MKSIKKTNYKFAAAPVVLLPLISGNEYKIIIVLINIANITNNNTVSVSYSYLMKALNISKQTLITSINNLIKLNLISRISGNITTNNSYIINFDYIIELDSKQTLEIPIEETIIEPSIKQTIDIPTEKDIIEPSVEQIEEIKDISTNEIINVNKEPINECDTINEKKLFSEITDYINSNKYESVFDNINNINEHFTKKEITYLRKHFDKYKKSNPTLINLFNKIYMAI